MVEVSSTFPIRNGQTAEFGTPTRSPTASTTQMVQYAFRAEQAAQRFIARRERIPGSCRENGDAREPFLSPSLGTTLPIMTLLAPSSRSDLIRSREISRPSPVKSGGPCSFSVHLGSVSHVFRAQNVSTVQATGKRAIASRRGSPGRYSDPAHCAPRRDCAARHSSRPGLASGGVVPARSGRSARWLAIPSRCPTRDARPRRGP